MTEYAEDMRAQLIREINFRREFCSPGGSAMADAIEALLGERDRLLEINTRLRKKLKNYRRAVIDDNRCITSQKLMIAHLMGETENLREWKRRDLEAAQ